MVRKSISLQTKAILKLFFYFCHNKLFGVLYRAREEGSGGLPVASAAEVLRQPGNVNVVGCAASHELNAAVEADEDEQRGRLEQLAQETKDRRERIKASVSELQESLDYLRLSVKYLVFDLEATRRENQYLRKMLEETDAS